MKSFAALCVVVAAALIALIALLWVGADVGSHSSSDFLRRHDIAQSLRTQQHLGAQLDVRKPVTDNNTYEIF